MQASVKEDRQKWIGGSDIPSIMGISPFTTRFDLLLFKAGLQENEFNGNEYTEYGNVMEDKIRTYINETYKREFKETKYEYKETSIRCHLDGEDDKGVLEVKTTSQIHDDVNEYEVYLVQLLLYMKQTGHDKGILAVYERPEDFNEELDPNRLHTYEIDIKDYQELVNEIYTEIDRFKMDLERVKENPLITEEELLPVPIQEISHQLENIENQLAMYKELEKQEKELKAKLYDAMEEYNIKKWKTPGGITITKTASVPDKTEMVFNENKFKEEQPIVYASYCEEQIKKGRKGSIRITL